MCKPVTDFLLFSSQTRPCIAAQPFAVSITEPICKVGEQRFERRTHIAAIFMLTMELIVIFSVIFVGGALKGATGIGPPIIALPIPRGIFWQHL